MSTLQERLIAENKRILKQGEAIGEKRGEAIGKKIGEIIGEKKGEIIGEKNSKRQIATNMINRKFDDKIILEITGIDKVELDKLKIK